MRQNKPKKYNPRTVQPFFMTAQELQYLHNTQQKSMPKSQFDAIENYYNFLSSDKIEEYEHENISIEDCFAVQLARVILDQVADSGIVFGNSFAEEFYKNCLEKVIQSELSNEIDDEEVLIIYIKQCVKILKTAQLIYIENKKACVDRKNISNEMLYYKLYNSFWNLTQWEDIFPSDEDAARELKNNRLILIDLLLSHYKRVKLDTLANDFFDLTGFSVKNDLMMISFLDFYFFNWLKHFGIISYIGSVNSPVYIEITEKGKRFLTQIQ